MDRLDRRAVWADRLDAALIQVMTGESWLTFYVLFPIASIAVTLWITYLGYRMWRIAVNATA